LQPASYEISFGGNEAGSWGRPLASN
jgi:hypothetical protein